MTADIIDGKAFAADVRARVGEQVARLKDEHGITPGLAVVLVGENPASQVYVRNKAKSTVEVGMHSEEHKLDASTSEEELLALIDRLNNDPKIHGILVQLPLPDHMNAEAVINALDPASQVYVRNKAKSTVEVGMHSEEHKLDASVSEEELLALIDRLNRDPKIHGILVQLPLPDHMNAEAVINALDPAKDADGFHILNVGLLGTGQKAMVPCTPLGCLMLLRDRLGSLSGKEAVVVGRSNIVGKPMAQLLLRESCTVTIAHSRTKDLPEVCRRADILVAAVGRPEMVKGDWVKPGATVIDVGINRVPAPEKGEGKHRIVGDVDFAGASEVAGAITPVPGGVGPMTIAVLLANTLTACCRANGLPEPEGLTL